MEIERRLRLPLICRICGDVARGMNFNVMTCISCKAFFRRNALRLIGALRCTRKFQCEIRKETRSNCAACRLKKCFVFGMKPQLIRSFAQHQLPVPQPLDLLHNDRSTLTTDQWNLVSNIIHAYDEYSPFGLTKQSLDEKSSLPLRFRGKPSLALDCMQRNLVSLEPIVKRSPDVQSLRADDRKTFITRNLLSVSFLNGLLIQRETNFLNDPDFTISFTGMYEPELLEKIINLFTRLNLDATAVKIAICVVMFSSNISCVAFDLTDDMNQMAISTDLLRIQEVYVAVLWKYLLHRYGFIETVRLYSSLTEAILYVNLLQKTMRTNIRYENMFDTTVKHFEYALIVEE